MGIILLWITGALIFGLLCKYLSLPVVIGFIAAGYCFGVTSFADEEGLLTIPSEIGVELLLFSLGLKIKPSSFLNLDLILVFFIHSIAVALTYYFLIDLEAEKSMKILLCIALTLSSTIIATKSLEARHELTSFHGRLAIIFLVFQDILALFLLLYSTSGNISLDAFYLIFLVFLVPLIKKILSNLQKHDELELIGAVVIALFLGAFLFKIAGLTGELGALIMGILLSKHEAAERLSKKIWSLREILLLAFFISLGMKLELDFQTILSSFVILAAITVKSVILFLLLNSFKLRAYTAFLVIISLASYSEFLLILSSYWGQENLISNKLFNLTVCVVCLSFIIGSILNTNAHEIYVLLEKFLTKFERAQHHPDEQPHTCGEANVMIVGMGRIGTAIFRKIQENNIKVVGFDADTDCVKQHLSLGRRVTYADVEDPGFWSKLRFGKLDHIILATPTFHSQNWSLLQARKYGFTGKIIVPIRTLGDEIQLKNSGADYTYYPYEASADGLSEILLNS